MENLNNVLRQTFGFEMGADFIQRAVYSAPMDCVTYSSADKITVSDRIDEFLTILKDAYNTDEVIGFKVKGFRHFFSTELKDKYNLNEIDFIPLVSVLEELLTVIGKELDKGEDSERRAIAYKQALTIAERDNVSISRAKAA